MRLFGVALLWCGLGGATERSLLVSAAVSLKEPFEALAQRFTKDHPEIKITFNFAASGDLVRQIEAGAPVDLLATAAAEPMDRLERAHLIEPASRRTIAHNRLVLVTPRNKWLKWAELMRARRVAIGDPRTVPAGQYALELLDRLGLRAQLEPRLLYAANVRVALDLAARGEAEAAIVYATDPVAASGLVVVDRAPDDLVVSYPMAVVSASQERELGRAFIALVMGPGGRQLLRGHGFLLP